MAMVLALFVPSLTYAEATVSGYVLEQDSIAPIENAMIVFSGISEEGDTLSYSFCSDTLGYYEAQIEAGAYLVVAAAAGYGEVCLPDSLLLAEGDVVSGINFILNELCNAVSYVSARQLTNDFVRVYWSMNEPPLLEGFESGDFDQFRWDNTISAFPWAIDSEHAYEGSFCMKSTCEGQADGLSQIEVPVYVPSDGNMSFYARISSETLWDVGLFYIDGVKQLECSGAGNWEEHHYPVTEGEHVFRWCYKKDSQTDEAEDCFYVDDIRFLQADRKNPCANHEGRSFQYYDVFRRRFDENAVLLASHVPDTSFMEMNWAHLPWGRYGWGVSCYYEGNRAVSDTVWSVYLDKDMTTTFELSVTTNIGTVPSGASVALVSFDGQGQSYQASLDSDGHLLLPAVYRDDYHLTVHLAGYEDFVSDEAISVFGPMFLEIELEEKLWEIDSLYVSSTGWAMWQWPDLQCRDLQYFEIKLNDQAAGTTLSQSFQFDVTHLEDGVSYLAEVRPVFVSGTGGWCAHEWEYHPCSDYQGTTEGLGWSLQEEAVLLFWDYPENEDVMGAMLYRDDEFLGFVEEDSFMDGSVVMQGEVTYCVQLVYDGPLDGTYYSISCEECVTASFPAYCDPPTKLEGENYYENGSDYGALVSWGERPPLVEDWLHYDNGTYMNAIGNDGEPRLFWAIRFDAEDLMEYQGTALTKVSLYDVGAGTYQLWIYMGGESAPQTLVRYQDMALQGAFGWHEQTIEPFEIPENEPVWIVIGQQGLSRPAAACADMGDPDGRWVSMDGSQWHDMHDFNVSYTWMLRAFVTNHFGKERWLGNENFVLEHYNLFRSYDNTDYQRIAIIPAVEGVAFYQYRDVLVGTDHDRFYYRLTALYRTEEGEECESDYAASLLNPDDNFVLVDDHWSVPDNPDAEVEVYPNPTSDVLFIEGHHMKSVAVFNALGQKMLEETPNTDALQLHLSGWNDGLYWLRLETPDGVVTRPFVIYGK